jgi:hypothetical protein
VTGFSPRWDRYLGEDEAYGSSVGGTGSAQTLPMTDEELAAVVKRPLGFTAPAEKPKRKRRKAT